MALYLVKHSRQDLVNATRISVTEICVGYDQILRDLGGKFKDIAEDLTDDDIYQIFKDNFIGFYKQSVAGIKKSPRH